MGTLGIIIAIALVIWSQTQKTTTGELTSAGKTAHGFGKTILWIFIGILEVIP